MLRAAAEGIRPAGRRSLGEKTLLDALIPATDTIEAAVGRGETTAEIARATAKPRREAAEATKLLEAKRGRASYTGERSIGSVDAGAMALAIIAERIADNWPPADPALPTDFQHCPPHHPLTPSWRKPVKKFVNDPKQFVPEMLQGIALANPDTLKYVPEYNLIMRADAPNANKVSIVQGSGSGHEPAHVMVVGKGMLDAACPGDVFAAPPMDYVLETTKLVASPKGVLLLVNNYTGDRMAFEMAQEMAEAEDILVRRCSSTTTSRCRTPRTPSAGAASPATSS